MIPTSDILRDVQIADELVREEQPYIASVPILGSLYTWVTGTDYGNQTYIDSERERILADLRGDPAGSWLTQLQQYDPSVSGPNWAEIERVLAQHPEAQAELDAALAREQPSGPTLAQSFAQTYGPIGEGISGALSNALATGGGILTLVVVGIVGLAILSIRR